MPRVPVVPIPDLAVAFLESVAEGGYPVREMALRFDLTYEQAAKRSWRLRKSGWLPAGEYTSEGWLELAREMVDERLDALAEREVRDRQRLARRLQRARASLARQAQQYQCLPVQVRRAPTRAASGVAAKPRRRPREESVLDVFG